MTTRKRAAAVIAVATLLAVQQLLVDVVAAGANEIEAVDFDVIGKDDMRAEARRQAVAAARRKAELYADAAGPPRRCRTCRRRGP
jgi:uncharacterized protein YggE